MNLVTLTTDYGNRDYYSAALKAKLIQCSGDIHIVDITHEITPYHFGSAAFQVRNAIPFFPAGTIHFIDVSFSIDASSPYLIMKHSDQYVVACDNGVFSLILEDTQPQELYRIYSIDLIKHASYPAVDIFPVVLSAILQNKINTVAEPFDSIQLAQTQRAIMYDKMIRAGVLHIDHHQNIILNIKRADFEKVGKDKRFVIRVRRTVEVDTMSQTYAEVSSSNVVAFFNYNDYLEIAMNQGNLAALNDVNIGDTVQIDFQ